MKRNPTTRRLLLIVVALLAAGLVWGLAGALAASSSPSPASGKVVLKIGWTIGARQPEPVRGLGHHDLRDLGGQLRLPVRLRRPDHGADARPRGAVPHPGKRRHLARRQGLDHPPEAQSEVVGRPAAHRRRRRLHLQLRRQEPHGQHGPDDRRHHRGQGDRPDHRADRLLPAQGRHGGHLPADPARARLGARLAARWRRRPTSTSRRSSAAARSTRWPSRRAPTSRWSATPTTGARSRPSTRSSSRCTRIPTRWCRT